MTERKSPHKTLSFSLPKSEGDWREKLIQLHKPHVGFVVFAASIALTLCVYVLAVSTLEKRAQLKFSNHLSAIEGQLLESVMRYRHGLQIVAGYFGASQEVEREEWSLYVESTNLQTRMPGLEMAGLIRWVPQNQWPGYAAELNKESPKGLMPLQDSIESDAAVFHFIEPQNADNSALIGSNIYSDQKMRAVLERARNKNELVLHAMRESMGETESSSLYLFYPLQNTIAHSEFMGWVFLEFDTRKMFEPFLSKLENGTVIRIANYVSSGNQWTLYESELKTQVQPESAFNLSHTISLFNMDWQVEIIGDEQYWRSLEPSNAPIYVLLVGLLINGLLLYVLLTSHLINRHLQLESLKLQRKYEEFCHSLTMQARLVEDVEREADAFFEMAPDALLVVNQHGEIVKANESAHEMFNLERGKLLGISVEALMPKSVRDEHVALRKQYYQSPSRRVMSAKESLLAIRSNGEAFPISINLTPINFQGETHTVASVHDLSEQKAIEKSLEDERARAESNSKAKSEFVANMSHEIRTPLNAVLGSAQLLAKTDLDKKQNDFVSMIRSSGEALLAVINDILDFSKIEAGKMELTETSFDLQELLNRVAVMMSVNVGEKDLELVIDVGGDVPLQLVGDPLRLQQVLINLVSNALKFTEKGTVVLSVETAGEKQSGMQTLCFNVSDTGIGMDEDQQRQLFQAFSQADTSISRRYGGTGLGLIISNNIVSLMGGKICVASELNTGTTFKFKIQVPVVAKQGTSNLPNTQGQTVAVIEHRPLTLASIEKMFMRWGWNWSHFESLAQYRDAYNNNPSMHQYDFLLTHWLTCGYETEAFSDLRDRRICASDTSVVCYFSNNEQLNSHLSDGDSRFDATLTQPLVALNVLDAFNFSAKKRKGKGIVTRIENTEKEQTFEKGIGALLVEDNPLNQTIAANMLEDMGVEVTIVNSGLEAVEYIRQAERKPSIIFMDIQMPVMDGVTATKILRNELNCDIPIIAMTAGVLKSEREEYMASGMNDFVPKPIDANELFRAVTKILPNAALDEESENPETVNSDIFDSQRLEALAKGKENRIRTMCEALEKLCNEGEAQLRLALGHYSDNDETAAKFQVHSLKGVAGNYGAVALHASLEQLEQLILKHEDESVIARCVQKANRDIRDFSELALPWCEQQLSVFEKEDPTESELDKNITWKGLNIPEPMCVSLIKAASLNNVTQLEAGLLELAQLGDEAKKLSEVLSEHMEQFETQKIVDVLGSVAHSDR